MIYVYLNGQKPVKPCWKITERKCFTFICFRLLFQQHPRKGVGNITEHFSVFMCTLATPANNIKGKLGGQFLHSKWQFSTEVALFSFKGDPKIALFCPDKRKRIFSPFSSNKHVTYTVHYLSVNFV